MLCYAIPSYSSIRIMYTSMYVHTPLLTLPYILSESLTYNKQQVVFIIITCLFDRYTGYSWIWSAQTPIQTQLNSNQTKPRPTHTLNNTVSYLTYLPTLGKYHLGKVGTLDGF